MGDELVDLESTPLVVGDELVQLRAALDTTKGATSPDTTGDELECYGESVLNTVNRTRELTSGGNLLASSSNTNDNALTPALVAGLQSSAHDADVASAVEGVVATAIGHLNELLDNSLSLELGRVHEVSGTKLLGPSLLVGVDVHNNDLASFVDDSTLDDGQTDAAGTEDGNVGALLNLGGDTGSTVAGGDTATEQAGSVEGSILLNGNDRDVGDDSVLGEGGGSHEVEKILTLAPESRGAVRHHTLALGGSNLAAQVGLARLAELALSALRGAVGGTVSVCLKMDAVGARTRERRHGRRP